MFIGSTNVVRINLRVKEVLKRVIIWIVLNYIITVENKCDYNPKGKFCLELVNIYCGKCELEFNTSGARYY